MTSSPTGHVDAQYIISEVAMYKGERQVTCLLVEGIDDRNVYTKMIDEHHCEIILCNGKENLMRAINILNNNNTINGYLAIKDCDFDILNKRSLPPNIVTTDGHDLEVMIMSTEAFDYVIDVRVRNEDKQVVKKFKHEIKLRLFELGALIGYLNFVTQRHGWGVSVQTHNIIDRLDHDCTLTLNDVINELKATYPHIDETQFSEAEYMSLSSNYKKHLCQGHDLIYILSKIFQKIATRHFPKKINPGSDLADRFFLAFNFSLFQTTQLYSQIQEWEARNHPYQVLKS